jgi:hypothetical protein
MFFIIGVLLTFQLANLAVQREYNLIQLWNASTGFFDTRMMLVGIGAAVSLTLVSLNFALPLDLLNELHKTQRQLNGALRALKAYQRNPIEAHNLEYATRVLERIGEVVIPFPDRIRKDA